MYYIARTYASYCTYHFLKSKKVQEEFEDTKDAKQKKGQKDKHIKLKIE